MNIVDILAKPNFQDVINELTKDAKKTREIKKYQDQYGGKHEILKRVDKVVGKGTTTEKTVVVSKLAIPFQKKIVNARVAFLFGDPAKYVCKDEAGQALYDVMDNILKANKIAYFDRQLARTVMSETRAAEYWYAVMESENGAEVKKVRVALWSSGNGDGIYPHWNEYGDMDAFTRMYDAPNDEGKSVAHCDIYTDVKIVEAVKDNGWQLTEKPNPVGKIPVVFYEQDSPEWNDVESLIERIEMGLSKHADVNEYYGDPIVKLKGKLVTPFEKEEVGKVLTFDAQMGANGGVEYGDAEYLTWDELPESRKMEYENLKDLIYSMTSTPDLSFQNVKGIGNISGVTIRMMFMDAMMEAQNKQEIFGAGLERRVSVLKAMIGRVYDLTLASQMPVDIGVQFGNPLPQDVLSEIQALTNAVGGEAIMSQETAIRKNPLVDDPEAEVELVQAEPKKPSFAELMTAERGSFAFPPKEENEEGKRAGEAEEGKRQTEKVAG